MNKFKIVSLASAVIFDFGCRKHNLDEDLPIRVDAASSLQVKVGDDVRWTFKAWRGKREITVMGINFGGLPFGLKAENANYQPAISGKVLGRQFRTGILSVSAFDSLACEAGFDATKKLALRNAISTGAIDVTIPTSPCDPAKMASSLQEYGIKATFQWNLVDGPDDISLDDIPGFLTSLAPPTPVKAGTTSVKRIKKSLRATILPANTMELYVPRLESTHTFDLSLGPCAAMPKNRCGDLGKKCLWNLGACSTAELNALKPEPAKI